MSSKMIIRAANTLAEARRAGKLAGHATVEPDWSIVAQRIREEATDDWDDTVGVELAQAFARFGTAVTIVEAADRLLPAEEPQAGELIGEVLRREGIRVLSRTRLRRVSHDGGDFMVHLDGAGPVHSQRLLVATGRRADLKALGVAEAGIDGTQPFIAADDHLRAAGVWSVGDVTGAGRSRTSRSIKRA